MLRLFSRKPSVYAGLAVHAERLCLVTLKKTAKHIVMEGMATCPLPPDARRPEAVRELMRLAGMTRGSGALALPASQVMNKRIRVPDYLTEHERVADIRSNLAYYLPGINDPLYFDFIPLKKEGQDRELQFIAARAEQVETWLRVTQMAGLMIKVVDVDVYAIARAVQAIAPSVSEETVVILDKDTISAQLVLLVRGKVMSVYPLVIDTEDILLQQIKQGMQVFLATESFGLIEKIILTGCVLDQNRWKTILEVQCGLPVLPLESTDCPAVSGMLVAYGLAWRGFSG